MSVLKHTIAVSGALALLLILNIILAAWYGALPEAAPFALVLSGAAVLLVFLLIKRVLLPLREVEGFLRNMADNGFGGYLRVRSDDLGELTTHINRLSELLSDSEIRHKDLVMTLPDAVVELDRSGALVYLNDAALSLTGYKPDEIRKLDYTDLTPHGSHHEMKEVFQSVLEGNTVSNRELPFIGKDCRESLFRFTAVPLWKGREPSGCLLIGMDTEEKKRLSSDLKSERLKSGELSSRLNKAIQSLEEFSLMAVRRELKMREIRERLANLKKDAVSRKEPFDRTA